MVPQALRGKHVIELGQYIAAPVCGQLLADFGAEVTKVEPASGDGSRQVASNAHGSLYTRTYNTGKASRILELRNAADQGELDQMLSTSDALVMNLAPSSLERLGLTWRSLHERHPHLVVSSISGYGLQDPRTCMDMVAQCESGFAALNADEDGTPRLSTSWPVDLLSGLYAGISTAMALLDAGRSVGVHVDVSMLEVAVSALLGPAALIVAEGGEPSSPTGNRDRSSAPSNVYGTQDGWVYVSAGLDHYWRKLAPLVGGPDHDFSARVASAASLDKLVERWTKTNTASQVLEAMAGLGIPAGAVASPAEAVARVSALRPQAGFSRLPSGEAVPSFPSLFSGQRPKRSPAPHLGREKRTSERFIDDE